MGTSTVTTTLPGRLFACLALLSSFTGTCLAEEPTPRAPTDGQRPIRVVILSELPEAITYYDQGFADFMRASKSVPLAGISFSKITQDAVINALSERQVVPSLVPVPESFAKQRAEIVAAAREKVWSNSVYESTKALLPQLRGAGVDAVIVVSPGKTPSERFME